MKLYELTAKYNQLMDNLEDKETGEITENSLNKLNEVKASLEEKCIAVAYYLENLEAERKAIKEAKEKMVLREKRFKSQIESLKCYLLLNMERAFINKVRCPHFEINLHKNPASVDIFDDGIIPPEYKKVVIENDIAKMRADLLNGVIIPGAKLIQNNSVKIK